MDPNYSEKMQTLLYMLEEGDFDIKDLLKLKYEVDYHVAAYFEYLSLDTTRKVLEGETAQELNRGEEGKEKLQQRKERFSKSQLAVAPKKKWHGTIRVSGLPCTGKDAEGAYVFDLFERYSPIIEIKFLYHKSKKLKGQWTGEVILLLWDLDAKAKLIKDGLYLPEHKEYNNVKVQHHQKIEWSQQE